MMDFINQYVIPHWPLFVVSGALALLGQVLKGSLFSKVMAEKHVVMWWGRKTLPVHPVFIGMTIGFVPGVPVGPGITTTAAQVIYFMGAGLLSTWLFSFLKQIAKKRGFDFKRPGENGNGSSPTKYPGT